MTQYSDDDLDSAYGDDSLIGDDTKTLSTYITDYRYEFGRRYHSYRDGAYWGPNDEPANAQQDLAHHMYFLTLDGQLHLAPIENPQEILDVGTGTGIWAIDAADEYPSARVTGVDLSPIQPSFVPPNCIFEIDDITLPWTYAENQFDFIHIREMFGCIPDWDEFFRHCWHCLKPGGYIEVVEHSVQPIADDETMGPDHFYHEWGRIVVESGERSGKTFTIWEESSARLKDAGFVDIVEKGFKWPMNGFASQFREFCTVANAGQRCRWSSDPTLHELVSCTLLSAPDRADSVARQGPLEPIPPEWWHRRIHAPPPHNDAGLVVRECPGPPRTDAGCSAGLPDARLPPGDSGVCSKTGAGDIAPGSLSL
ncbi:uncharacterized protein DSM5745_03997 [Aspergillus mulundensis]|uniref:S-adenosyl-L-methionine-dependent methyltransferase n=1 Tax=Aspergillus mulundensis TaxID=1810919 RepID=A0A3D8SBV8_9EURO|nr:Uncharacterized protein DSM5745_03997 [Aspergillus mulundensis]RDW83671.1 Uncharacterized protein DSM5745_03997 [Aspergillus mulundensis]